MLTNSEIRAGIEQLLVLAPPSSRTAALALFKAAKTALDAGYMPDVRGVPLKSWRCLLGLLADVAAMRYESEPLLRVASDLLSIADKMAPPAEVLRQSAEIMVHALHADLYVCRLRNNRGEWRVYSAARADGGPVPMLSLVMDERLKKHPVMNHIQDGVRYVLSNNLRSIELGGESIDCMVYKAGYRSRLAFVLRDRLKKQPFGLVMLYTERDYGFDVYDSRFLSKCATIFSLTVGRRIAIARDTLEKASGAVAHHGNNALNILKNQAELCCELLEDMDDDLARAQRLGKKLTGSLQGDPREETAKEFENALKRLDFTELAAHLGGVLEGSRRVQRIINALKKSVEKPRLMHYALGHDVLDLGDTTKDE